MADGFQLASEEDADLRPLDLSVLPKLLPFVRPHSRKLVFGFGLVLVSTGLGPAGPKIL